MNTKENKDMKDIKEKTEQTMSEALHVCEIVKQQNNFAAMALNGMLANRTFTADASPQTLAIEAVEYSNALVMALIRMNELKYKNLEEK